MNADPNPYLSMHKNSETWIYIPSSFFCLRSERIFWQNSSWTSERRQKKKDGYSFISRCFDWIRVRIRGSINKHRDMNLQREPYQWPQTQYAQDNAQTGKNCQVHLRLRCLAHYHYHFWEKFPYYGSVSNFPVLTVVLVCVFQHVRLFKHIYENVLYQVYIPVSKLLPCTCQFGKFALRYSVKPWD